MLLAERNRTAILVLWWTCVAGTNVAVLTNHNPNAWDEATACGKSSIGVVDCNLKVFEQAAIQAASHGVEMLVLPEGYSLGQGSKEDDYFEPFDMEMVGKSPCQVQIVAIPQTR